MNFNLVLKTATLSFSFVVGTSAIANPKCALPPCAPCDYSMAAEEVAHYVCSSSFQKLWHIIKRENVGKILSQHSCVSTYRNTAFEEVEVEHPQTRELVKMYRNVALPTFEEVIYQSCASMDDAKTRVINSIE